MTGPSTGPGGAPEPRDVGFDQEGAWFRLRACGVVLREGPEGLEVLMAANSRDPYLYSVGGGVQHGEELAAAALREVREETGLDGRLGDLLVVHENFFGDELALPGRRCHELAFHFLVELDGEPAVGREAGQSHTMDGHEEWLEWVPVAEVGRGVTAYPGFFADLPRILAGPRPARITTRE